jgi:hypothetical protein
MAASAIMSWRRLKILDESHPTLAYATAVSSVTAAEEKTKQDADSHHEYLRAGSKPRRVRFRPAARVISIAFPISLIVIAYSGFLIRRNGPLMSSDLFALLVGAAIWCVIAIAVIRVAQRDRKLLAEGDLAIAVVTHQELSGDKYPRSEIHYEFRDSAGRTCRGKTTDNSRQLYEEMQTPVFYNPANPDESVPLVAASSDLKEY